MQAQLAVHLHGGEIQIKKQALRFIWPGRFFLPQSPDRKKGRGAAD
jgi:predicted YcjX-like family ATPase